MSTAIEVQNVSKTFRIYREKYTSVKERILHFGRIPFEEFRALDDVSLTIEAGETIGLLGHNGSGKSTLLKCMAGILQPTAGTVRTVGRMAALLELGTGFHPDLSGRDNIYLNASILGMRRVEVDRIFDEIVDFSGIEQFIDTPVKRYSSGMYVRLGFSVAIHVDPEILLVDEVLAVGDEAFQNKCLDRVRRFQREGRTIVVVTHAPDMVRQLCNRAAALDHGQLVAEGDPNDVIRVFREKLMAGVTSVLDAPNPDLTKTELSPMWHRAVIKAIEVEYPPGQTTVKAGQPLTFAVHVDTTERVDDIVAGIAVYGPQNQLAYGTNTHLRGQEIGTLDGPAVLRFRVSEVPMLDGTYSLTVGLHTLGGLQYDHWEQRCRFEVDAPGRDVGVVALPIDITVERDS